MDAERQSWSSNNAAGAFASPLKLPVAGYRFFNFGSLDDVGSIGGYWSSTVSGTYAWRLYFGSSSAGVNSDRRANGLSVRCIKHLDTEPTVTTTAVTSITATSAVIGGNITYDGGPPVSARGIVWSTAENPTVEINEGITSDGTGSGTYTSNITGLTQETTYYLRAYATNSVGTSYGNQVSCITLNEGDVYNPITGKVWMDKNLGASQVATSSTDAASYGDLYQWGRGTDGHESRTSGTTSTLSDSDTPGHGNFIVAPDSPYDWRSGQNANLWQGVGGVNNPCPSGYRIPTLAEWDKERLSWSSYDAAGAFASPLKLPMAGQRYYSFGGLYNVGSYGDYWSSNVFTHNSGYFYFRSSTAGTSANTRATGMPVRCIKD